MSYGFDLWEWVDGKQLDEWHRHLHQHFGWPHLLGGRWEKNQLSQATEALDYSSYEQHRPDYRKYVELIEKRPAKPSFAEDRFRVREPSPYPDKDYTLDMTRRGLWHSTMAGSVANIWVTSRLRLPKGARSRTRIGNKSRRGRAFSSTGLSAACSAPIT